MMVTIFITFNILILIYCFIYAFGYTFKVVKTTEIEEKDPADYSKSVSSTHWVSERYYCRHCKSEATQSEYMSDICSSCGEFRGVIHSGRSYRKIYIDGKWKYQYKYKDNKSEDEIVDCKY